MTNQLKELRNLLEQHYPKQKPVSTTIRNNNITETDNRSTIVKTKYANGLLIKAKYQIAPNPLMSTPDITVKLSLLGEKIIRVHQYTTPSTDNLENFSKNIVNDVSSYLKEFYPNF